MNKLARVTAISALVAAISSVHAQAATFTEMGDAGETLSTAEVIRGSQPLDSISGALPGNADQGTFPGSADLFKLSLTGGGTFSATTVGGASFDTQLFLFNSKGIGIYGNDNASLTLENNQSTLPKGDFSPTKSGLYYLAISGFNYDPVSDQGEIFPNPGLPFSQVFGPTGPGGGSPLSGFAGPGFSGGSYTIALTGAKAVPEPSSVMGTALGALSVVWILKRKRNRSQS